jgi:glycosyltransferase involved in cell wall biosynthesis
MSSEFMSVGPETGSVKSPTVSVIVPNYNHSRFLRERLDSILNQTYQDYELILLDDCSTDTSVAILQEYGYYEKVTHLIVNSTNSGSPFLQWKRGLELAVGKYIWIAESDDCAKPSFLHELVNAMEASPTVVLAYCQSMTIDANGRECGLHDWAEPLSQGRWRTSYVNQGENEIRDFLAFRNTIPNASSTLLRKSTLQQVAIPLDMRFCGDWVTYIRLLRYGDISFVAKPLSFFRSHDTTTRVRQTLDKEVSRCNEYLSAICEAGLSISEMVKARDKYEWILGNYRNLQKLKPKSLLPLPRIFDYSLLVIEYCRALAWRIQHNRVSRLLVRVFRCRRTGDCGVSNADSP